MKKLRAKIEAYSEKATREKRLYILPTFNGAKLFGLTFILLFTGLIYTNNFILFFNFLLFSLFICSMFYTHFNLGKIRLSGARLESSYADHLGNLKLVLHNDSEFPRYFIQIQFREHEAFHIDPIIIPKIEALSSLEISQEINLKKRGHYKLPRAVLSTTFPFNFFRTFTYFYQEESFYIYPRPKVFSYDMSSTQSPDHSPDDSSLNLKQFRPGDSFKHIHWKKFALDETLLLKEMENDRSWDLLVEADELVGHMPLEEQLSALSFLVSELMTKGLAFGLVYRDMNFEPSKERDHVQRILERLAVVKPT